MTTMERYLEKLWSDVLEVLYNSNNESLDRTVIDTYFLNARIVSHDNGKVIIIAEDAIAKQILISDKEMIETILKELLTESNIICSIILENELEATKPTPSFKDNSPSLEKHYFQLKLKPEYTFENFIVGKSNKESQAAALACAYNPGKFYTPLFIFGNSGLGKTHLLQAIGNFVKKHSPEKKIYYTSGTDFVESVVSSIQNQCIDEFKRKLYEIDVLLMDDVQFIAGKEKSHEVFFSIFNELVNNRKQICITSDKHPKEIKGLEERLISRFSSGLSVGVDSPEFETAVAILRLKINNQIGTSVQISDDSISYMATHFSRDVRSLEGCITRLLFMSVTTNTDYIDLQFTIDTFKKEVTTSNEEELSINKIKKEVADYYGLTKQQLVSKTRTSNIAKARHIAMYLCRKLMDVPFVKIGEEFGKRDHSTVMSACDKVEKNIRKDLYYKQAISEIETRIKG